MVGEVEPTWIITRAAEDGLPLVAELSARGIAALALPCIEREPLAWPDWPFDSSAAHHLIFLTSLASARGALAWSRAHAGVKVSFAAQAPRTDAWLVAQGLEVAVASPQGAVGLAQAVVEWAKKKALHDLRVLYPSSDAGELQPEQIEAVALLAPIGTVDRATVYQTRAPDHLDTALLAVPAGPTRWFFASPSAVTHAVAALHRAHLTPAVDVLCLGHSTLRAWQAAALAGWPAGRLHSRGLSLVDSLSQPLGAQT